MTGQPTVHHVFEPTTGTFQYFVADPSTLSAAIIDPVLDYDPVTQVISTNTANALLSLVKEKGYKVDWILETHAHADHLTASFYLQRRLSTVQGHKPPVGIGKRIGQVQKTFGQRYLVSADEYEGVFDKLFDDDETFRIGEMQAMAMHLPGHTPDHLGYRVGGKLFTIISRPSTLLTQGSQTTCSVETPSSTSTSALRGVIFQGEVQTTCSVRGRSCCASRTM